MFSAAGGRTIYGAKATQGCVRLNQRASVYRLSKLVFVSSVSIRTLKRFNCPVDAVRCGQEFGFTLNEQRRIKVGDVLKTL